MKINKIKIFLVFLITIFAVVNIFGFENGVVKADTAGEIQDKLDSYEKKLKDAQAELLAEQSKLYKNQAQISATQALVKRIQSDMARQEAELLDLNERAKLNRVMLGEYVRQLYYADQEQDPLIKLSLFQGNISDMTMNFDGMLGIKAKIIDALQIIDEAKSKTEQTKAVLADQKQDGQQALKSQQVQQAQIVNDVQDAKATLQEIQQKIAELRSSLSSFLGKSYSTKDIDDAVSFASKTTGIRKEYLQAELIVETGYGTFTGGCAYKNIRMRKADVDEFLKIAAELEKAYGGNYKNKKLSCSPKWGGYGGAMGVAQFMPTTWIGYKAKISSKTGSNPADPWDLADGITGMAIKLANAGATSKGGEVLASKRYYCGGPSSPYWKTKCAEYAKKVQYFSKDPESHI